MGKEKGAVDCWHFYIFFWFCFVFFPKWVLFVWQANKQQALIKTKKKKMKAQKSSGLVHRERKRGCQKKCLLIVRRVFSILITHMGRVEIGGVTSLTAHHSYFCTYCASLTFHCSVTLFQRHFYSEVGKAYSTTVFYQNK